MMLSKHTPILVYHQIASDGAVIDRYSTPAGIFEQQMQFLSSQGYHCITLRELIKSPPDRPCQHNKTFVLTFDDGYENFLRNAYPILHRYGFTATVFLVTDLVGNQSNWEGSPDEPILSWGQVNMLFDAGIDFGSHTCSHPRLHSLDNVEIQRELKHSKEYMEDKLGREIQCLAYPYGESNYEVQKIALETGYEAACGVVTGDRGIFNLWRYPCGSNDTQMTFSFKLTMGYDYYLQWRKWVREDTILGRRLRKLMHQRPR